MKKPAVLVIASIISFILYSVVDSSSQQDSRIGGTWKVIEPGLEIAAFSSPKKSIIGDSLIRVLRINPENFEFRLINSSAIGDKKTYSAKNWAIKHGLIAAINASMYQGDRQTSVSLMQTKKHINNSRISKDKVMLAFDPLKENLPEVKILDKDCHDFDHVKTKYKSLIQSIRMISCKGENVWQQQKKIWSISAIGMDKDGNILFIHSRSPYSTHDFINILFEIPISIKRAMYTDGGSVAQMYVKSHKYGGEFLGSYSTGSNESDSNFIGWPIPNVIGIVRKSDSTN
ncbi:MAG: phosphodiester glycosidase family protein [Nitrospinales bacterium]